MGFRQIHGPTGKRGAPLNQKTVPGVGHVDTSDILEGLTSPATTKYLLSRPPRSRRDPAWKREEDLELVQVIGTCEISPLNYNRPYYRLPTDRPRGGMPTGCSRTRFADRDVGSDN